jgi:hypothetical protein
VVHGRIGAERYLSREVKPDSLRAEPPDHIEQLIAVLSRLSHMRNVRSGDRRRPAVHRLPGSVHVCTMASEEFGERLLDFRD